MVRDPYNILQLAHHAEPEVVEAAYRRLARKYHPDQSPSVNATAHMQDINWAYQILKDPAKRASYDRTTGQGVKQPPPKSSTSSRRSQAPPPTAKTKPKATASVKRPRSAYDRERSLSVELFALMIALLILLGFLVFAIQNN